VTLVTCEPAQGQAGVALRMDYSNDNAAAGPVGSGSSNMMHIIAVLIGLFFAH
jgi:ABC-type iron transport system FetAB ATPase subunit